MLRRKTCCHHKLRFEQNKLDAQPPSTQNRHHLPGEMEIMPLAVLLASFGGILILVGLVGGGFTFSGSVMPRVGKVARVPCFIVGAVLLFSGVIVAFIPSAAQGSNPQPTAQTWGDQANAICATAIKNGSGYVPSNPFNSQLPAAAQFADNWQSVDDQLRKLPANGQDQGEVTSMLDYWDQAITAMRAAIQHAQNSDFSTEQQDLSSSSTLTTEGNNLANELGAGTCASGVF
jgi:hypothetical protein